MRIALTFWLCLSVFLAACVGGQPADEPEPVLDYVAKCYEIAERVNLYGFDPDRPECRLAVRERRYDRHLMVNMVRVLSPILRAQRVPGLPEPANGPLFTFELDSETGMPVSITNGYLTDVAMARSEEEEKKRPTLSEQEVRRQAEDLVAQLRPDLKDMELTTCRYDPLRRTVGRVWRVGFSRKWQGYEVDDNFINLFLDDEHGLRCFYVSVYSKPGPVVLKVSRDDVRQAARDKVKELLSKEGINAEKALLNISRSWEQTLLISAFNYTYKAPAFKEMKQDETLLVHQFIYTVKAFENAASLEESWQLGVWVHMSAETGEYVCGDIGG